MADNESTESIDTTTDDASQEPAEDQTDAGQERTEDEESGSTDDGDSGSEGEADSEPDPTDPAEIFKAKKRKLDNENKNLRDRLAAAEAKLKVHEDKELSEKDRLERDLNDTNTSKAELIAENNRLKIQRQFPEIDDDLIDFVSGDSFEAMVASAEKLSAKLKAKAPARKSADAKDLTGGSDPGKNDSRVSDVRDLVKGIKRF